ncbi:hypothetical protein NM688_g5825 [Phlebia brevispora]|uniref:Uncharacterized protein n=1 Tax=Phlebia brevispora TaxID=194682 RepID=A0ACC1SPG5_9APHY|nr:hypothetical protein NM688_g5825 [Phlebia brevispora]
MSLGNLCLAPSNFAAGQLRNLSPELPRWGDLAEGLESQIVPPEPSIVLANQYVSVTRTSSIRIIWSHDTRRRGRQDFPCGWVMLPELDSACRQQAIRTPPIPVMQGAVNATPIPQARHAQGFATSTVPSRSSLITPRLFRDINKTTLGILLAVRNACKYAVSQPIGTAPSAFVLTISSVFSQDAGIEDHQRLIRAPFAGESHFCPFMSSWDPPDESSRVCQCGEVQPLRFFLNI